MEKKERENGEARHGHGTYSWTALEAEKLIPLSDLWTH